MKTISLIMTRIAWLRQTKWLNKYTIAFSIFLVWILFFDKHNMIVQYRLHESLNDMEKEMERHALELQAAESEREILDNQLERYAREKYYMHKPDEEVFVIERK